MTLITLYIRKFINSSRICEFKRLCVCRCRWLSCRIALFRTDLLDFTDVTCLLLHSLYHFIFYVLYFVSAKQVCVERVGLSSLFSLIHFSEHIIIFPLSISIFKKQLIKQFKNLFICLFGETIENKIVQLEDL